MNFFNSFHMRKFLLSALGILCVGVFLTGCQKPSTEEQAPAEDMVAAGEMMEEEQMPSTEEYENYSATIQLAIDTPMGIQENSARVYRKDGKVLYEFLEIPQMNPEMKIKKILSVDGKVYALYEIDGELLWGYEEGLNFPMQDLFDLRKTSDMFLSEIDPADTQAETVRGEDVECISQDEGPLKMKTCFLDGMLFDGSSEDTETGMTMTLHVEGFTKDVSDDVFAIPETTYSIQELTEMFQPTE